jgi:uncharacterized membrane protein YfcA
LLIIALLIVAVSALYGTAGQAGGSGFVAVMVFASFPLDEIRPTALALNVVAATYATIQVHRARVVDWRLLGNLLATSVPAAFLGGMIVLKGAVYSALTGELLLVVSILMATRASRNGADPVARSTALFSGAIAGFASGLSGVGGGVFLSAILILLGGVSPKKTTALSPPFIIVNSLAGLVGALFGGQRVPLVAIPFAGAAIIGSAIGTAIGLRWMSEMAIRFVLAAILLVASAQLLFRAV